MNDDELRAALVEAAYLEGDFLLRSGKRSNYYLDKYRFETRPDLPGAARRADRGRRRRARAGGRPSRRSGARRRPARRRRLARRRLCRSSWSATRRRSTAPRTGSKAPFEEGELVCFVEDVVTSGGALLEAIGAVREAGLVVRTAVCVVDREEGGADALARQGVRLRPLYRAGSLAAEAESSPPNRMVERQTLSW